MNVLFSVALLCVGLALVIVSADESIKRLLNLARYLRLSEFVVSFVLAGVIAILPELAIGVVAAAQGTSSLGFGVILGANVADLTLVIGVLTLFAGKIHLDTATKRNIRRSFIVVALPVLLFLDGEISRIDGAILIAAFAVYIYLLLRTKHDGPIFTERLSRRHIIRDTAILLVALALLLIGGILITDNSQIISLTLGLPLFIVGLIVAIGTCLPEMVFAIRSCNKLHCNLGLGNILGNVLADSLLTIGVIALIQPIKPALFISPFFTGIIMVVSSLIVYLLSKDGTLDRRDGLLLIMVYSVFIAVQSALA